MSMLAILTAYAPVHTEAAQGRRRSAVHHGHHCPSGSPTCGRRLALQKDAQQLRLSLPELDVALRLRGGITSAGALPAASSRRLPTLESLKVPIAFAGWYLMSIVYSVLNKQVLQVWTFPLTFSAVQLLVGSLWIAMLWMPVPTGKEGKTVSLREPPRLSRADVKQLMPVAIFLALGHALSTVAPAYGTVAFTNVVKTLEPLFTCALAAVFLGQIFSPLVYLSLVPVIAGVIVASTNEVSFSMASLVSGLLSNLMFALRALSAKGVMGSQLGKSLSPMNLYASLTLIALALLTPLGLAIEGPQLAAGTAATIAELGGVWPFVRLLLMTGVSHYVYNECAFVALSAVHPVTHAVANTVKRIAVIIVSVLYFRDALTLKGMLGSAVAVMGVFGYSLAKAHDGRVAAETAATAKKK